MVNLNARLLHAEYSTLTKMNLTHLISTFLLLASSYAIPNPANSAINWTGCPEQVVSSLPIRCGTVHVPLDYTDKTSNNLLKLQLSKVAAVKKPVKGTILLNFGGPGEEARATLGNFAYLLHAFSGGHYDLVAFDPRGTAETIPFTCYNDTIDLMTYKSYTSVFPKQNDMALLGKLWARGRINADACAQAQPYLGRLIGTAFVARDIKTVANILDNDGLIRYWGFSYGTTLGSTLVSMFPDEIDKVVLDGVQNPHEYYNAYADFEEWTQSDLVLAGIFDSCAKNPDKCSLSRHGKTGRELLSKVKELVENLGNNPIPMDNIIVDDNVVHLQLAGSLYATQYWPNLTIALDSLLSGKVNSTFLRQYLGADVKTDSSSLEIETKLPQALSGIHCLDRRARTSSWADFAPAVQELSRTSWAMGGASVALSMTCAQWSLEPKERYEGDFQVKPRNPVLLVGNRFDGHTPIRSARNVSSGFTGSEVLEVNGYGHISLVLPSACTMKKVSQYWMDGVLPKKGTICNVDAPPFSNVSWNDVIAKSGALDLTKRDIQSIPPIPAVLPWMSRWMSM